MTYAADLDADDLGRLIAKIGLGIAVAKHGVPAFAEVFVRNLILGDTAGGNQWVGGLIVTPVRASREVHAVGEISYGGLLAVWMQLFSPAPAASRGGAWPTYQVVVGRLAGQE